MRAVCAAVGNADAAFELYAAMKGEGVKTEAQVGCTHITPSVTFGTFLVGA